MLIRAEAAKARLTFITEALRKLLADTQFTGILSEEHLVTLPEALASKLEHQEGTFSGVPPLKTCRITIVREHEPPEFLSVEIMPLKQLSASTLKSVKYAQIAASIAELGIIEHLRS